MSPRTHNNYSQQNRWKYKEFFITFILFLPLPTLLELQLSVTLLPTILLRFPSSPVLAYLNFLWPASVTDTFLASWQRLSDHGNSTIKLCFGQCVSSAHTSQFEIREESTLSSDVEKIDVANLHLYRPLKTLLTTTENTITYHNALCFSLQNFA